MAKLKCDLDPRLEALELAIDRDVWRDYERRPMTRIPYRRLEGDPRAEEVAAIGRAIAENRALELRAGRHAVGRIKGDPKRLDLLEHILEGKADERLLDTLLPKEISAFRRRVVERRAGVAALLLSGRALVERVERLVCAIYDIPDDLTEQVVAHAVRRAG